jgi:predicted transcriptional regulator
MKLSQIKELLNCELLTLFNGMDIEVTSCISADMMSDVLAFASPGSLLITGLVNSQSVRTADIADAVGIVYVRGKRPDQQTLRLAEEMNIPVMCSELSMFEASGILFKAGLEGVC